MNQPLPPPRPLCTVGALVVNPNAEVLIVRTTKWRGTWGVPGGKLDWGESLQEALLREFREEVALDLQQVRFALLQEAILDSQFHVPAHFVLVNYYAFSASTQVVPNEEIVEWVCANFFSMIVISPSLLDRQKPGRVRKQLLERLLVVAGHGCLLSADGGKGGGSAALNMIRESRINISRLRL